ncbi:cytochrome P450 [Streptomyces sp. NPDC032198]|uniref:cytochrome P450 n=1 Tax=Streptomyces sp. NPDC032198 TaxID=3155127 RepID=UPI00340F7CD7
MTTPEHPDDFLHDLRRRSAAEDGVFWVNDDLLAVFEPEAAQRISRTNWRGFVMPDRGLDLLRGRRSPVVPWVHVRTAWLAQLHRLADVSHRATLTDRMRQVMDARLGERVDLVTLAQDTAIRSLLPCALSGLTPRETEWIVRDLDQKLLRLIDRSPGDGPAHRLRFAAVQARAGLVVRRVLRARAAGRRPRECDLADPFVDLLPQLGMDRALNVVTTVLTAIGGPPGSAAAAVLYEWVRQPEWARRVTAELGGLDTAAFLEAPTKAAPLTHRFVKETLRMWSPPLLLVRQARQAFDVGGITLDAGRGYLMSPHMIHRDHRVWKDADTFDPDRFLAGAPHGPAGRDSYVPFGWTPKKCVGAALGTFQLMALCRLMSTRYHLTVPNPARITMAFRFAPVPQDFHGVLTPRRPSGSGPRGQHSPHGT